MRGPPVLFSASKRGRLFPSAASRDSRDLIRRTAVLSCSHTPSLWLFRADLIAGLRRRGFRVIACGPRHPGAEEKLEALGTEFIEIGPARTSINPLEDIRYCFRLMLLYRAVRPTVVVAYTAKPVIWSCVAARMAGVPKIMAMITGLGYAFTGTSAGRSAIRHIVRTLYRIALRGCSSVVFQNRDDHLEFLQNGLVRPPPTSFVVNGSGVDLQHYAVAALPQEPVFLVIARLLRDKGIREFCEAAAHVRGKFPGARFRIVGWLDTNPSAITGRELGEWGAPGAVEYRGAVEDVRPEIASARVYVLPSYREGTPRTVLEAMAMGRPIITTDAPGCRETVVDGWNGYLVPLRDSLSLARAMERFVVEPELAEKMGANSRKLVESKYDSRSVAESLLNGAGLDDEAIP